jgi:hypothetical protein
MQPGIIKRVQESKMAFKCMENINSFLEAAKTFGVPSQELFQTVDLWERQNLNSVVICLQALGRKVYYSYILINTIHVVYPAIPTSEME